MGWVRRGEIVGRIHCGIIVERLRMGRVHVGRVREGRVRVGRVHEGRER